MSPTITANPDGTLSITVQAPTMPLSLFRVSVEKLARGEAPQDTQAGALVFVRSALGAALNAS